MGRPPKLAANNIFYKCRIQASKFNASFSNREGAAEAIGISASQLEDYETGHTKVIPVENAARAAEVYGAPEIRNYYCRNICPLGANVPELEIDKGLDRITVRAMSSLRKMESAKKDLLDITEDGIITEDEKPQLQKILDNLDEVAAIAQDLRAWVEKNRQHV